MRAIDRKTPWHPRASPTPMAGRAKTIRGPEQAGAGRAARSCSKASAPTVASAPTAATAATETKTPMPAAAATVERSNSEDRTADRSRAARSALESLKGEYHDQEPAPHPDYEHSYPHTGPAHRLCGRPARLQDRRHCVHARQERTHRAKDRRREPSSQAGGPAQLEPSASSSGYDRGRPWLAAIRSDCGQRRPACRAQG